ncbi:SOS response-associated peptidase family protein [Robbsia sp. Bb-Pol-6]|uniref:SOS response-associated peptidase family protein n=1 Tax=Robbsia betulipollinis TaxID=2981849 RepID=A0ABT3ZN09_9BURK|nr:SOS response-associated peptidase family protein [Robbsia betulipollinis]MCY0387928.1 SOS response-associated peptidase family protein [Robbsia betulipollinis]
MINARLDKAGTSTWKGLWKSHRVIVPCEGWYEWITEAARKSRSSSSPRMENPSSLQGYLTSGLIRITLCPKERTTAS